MAVSRRYQPSHSGGQRATYGLDLSPMLPPGTAIITAACSIQTNTVPPTDDGSIMVRTMGSHGRIAWATIEGGTNGTDYIMTWLITDNAANAWNLYTLLLCAATS